MIPLSKLPLFMYGEKGGKGGLRVRRTSVPGYWVTPSSDLQRLDGLGPHSCMNRIIPKGIPVLPPHGAFIQRWPRPSLVYESHYSQGNPCASSTWCLYFRWLRPSRVCIALPLWGPCAAATPTPHPRSNNSSFTFGHRNLPEWTVGKLTGHLLPGNTNVSVGIKI